MSRTSFDTLAKDLAVDLLASLGRVESDLRIVAEPQFADLFIELSGIELPHAGPRAFVGRLLERFTLLEFAQRRPDLATLATWTRKRDAKWHTLRTEAARHGSAIPRRPPLLLVLSAGDPKTLRAEYPLHPMPELPGCFQGAPANTVRLVVLSKLAPTRSTLLLRCMGNGATLRRALAELSALPVGAPEQALAARWITRFHLQRLRNPKPIHPEVTMQFQQLYETIMQQQQLQRGIEQGIAQGVERGIAQGVERGIAQGVERGIALVRRQCVRRLARALTAGEEATLRDRFVRTPRPTPS